jgi:hypothetical protein
MKKMMVLITVICVIAVSFVSLSCSSEKPKPMPVIFIGSWVFDIETFQNNPQLTQMIGNSKNNKAFELLKKALESVSMDVTADTFSLNMAGVGEGQGASNKKFQFKVTNASDTSVSFIHRSQGVSGGSFRLEATDNDHIKMINISAAGQEMPTLMVRKK